MPCSVHRQLWLDTEKQSLDLSTALCTISHTKRTTCAAAVIYLRVHIYCLAEEQYLLMVIDGPYNFQGNSNLNYDVPSRQSCFLSVDSRRLVLSHQGAGLQPRGRQGRFTSSTSCTPLVDQQFISCEASVPRVGWGKEQTKRQTNYNKW